MISICFLWIVIESNRFPSTFIHSFSLVFCNSSHSHWFSFTINDFHDFPSFSLVLIRPRLWASWRIEGYRKRFKHVQTPSFILPLMVPTGELLEGCWPFVGPLLARRSGRWHFFALKTNFGAHLLSFLLVVDVFATICCFFLDFVAFVFLFFLFFSDFRFRTAAQGLWQTNLSVFEIRMFRTFSEVLECFERCLTCFLPFLTMRRYNFLEIQFKRGR